MTMGAASAQEIEMMERESINDDASMVEDMGSRGQILWIRGLTRLQHQVRTPLRRSTSNQASLSGRTQTILCIEQGA